jgi:hypothetical protein
MSLRDFTVLQFGSMLMSHPNLWQVVVDYLMTVPKGYGRHTVKEVMKGLRGLNLTNAVLDSNSSGF